MINRLLKLPILVWHRLISPCLPPMCRFYPSCAAYALEALDTLPWYRAVWLSAWRVLRCNPFSHGGYDPVPDARAGSPKAPCACAGAAQNCHPPRHAADEPSNETMIARTP